MRMFPIANFRLRRTRLHWRVLTRWHRPGATQATVTAAVDAFSSQTGGANVNWNLPNATVTSVNYSCVQYVKTNMGIPCTGALAANAIQVVQKATIPTMFIQVLGPNAPKTLTLTATSTAA